MKRFCDTETLRDPWVLSLGLEAKLVYWFIKDNCDAAGVWEPNFKMVNFTFERDIEWETVKFQMTAPFNGDSPRVEILPNGKWYLTRFVAFQYGKLSDDCFPHRKILDLIEKHGLSTHSSIRGYIPTTLPSTVPPVKLNGFLHTRVDTTQQEKDKEKDKEGMGGVGGEDMIVLPPTADQIYEAYPKPGARIYAIKCIEKVIYRKKIDPIYILKRVKDYARATDSWPKDDRRFIPDCSTWFNKGRYEDDDSSWLKFNSTKNRMSFA